MSTLERGYEIEEDFYQLRSQEWAVSTEQAEAMVNAGMVIDQQKGARRVVYVIMGNDFPNAVFSDKALAEAWCVKHNEIEKQKKSQDVMHRRISWRSYEFTLDAEVGK